MPRFGGMGGAFGHMGGGGKVSAAVAAAFTPLSLTPALWIDPSDTTTMFQSNAGTTTVTDGSNCGYAGDKSGAAFNLTSVADDASRLTWVNNSSLPYLNGVAGSNQVLRKTTGLGLYAAGACSVFAAVSGNPLGSAVLVAESSATSTSRYLTLRALTATPSSESPFIRNDANTTTLADAAVSQVNAFDNTDRVVGFIDNGTTVTLYLDGVAGSPVAYTRSGVLTLDTFAIFATITSTTVSPFSGRLYGLVIVKSVITSGQIASLTTYLGAKQGRVL